MSNGCAFNRKLLDHNIFQHITKIKRRQLFIDIRDKLCFLFIELDAYFSGRVLNEENIMPDIASQQAVILIALFDYTQTDTQYRDRTNARIECTLLQYLLQIQHRG